MKSDIIVICVILGGDIIAEGETTEGFKKDLTTI